MEEIPLYALVRIRQMTRPPEAYDGWGTNREIPKVGDEAVVVDILREAGSPTRYILEKTGHLGDPIWVGDFKAGELEVVHDNGSTGGR